MHLVVTVTADVGTADIGTAGIGTADIGIGVVTEKCDVRLIWL